MTGSDWLYAVGDVNHRALLTHQGKYQARIAGAAIAARAAGVPLLETDPWGAHAATADHAAVPQVVFTDPEVASVGLSLAEAEQAGHRVRAVDYDLASVAGAGLYADGYRGRARMIVDLDTETLRGVTFVGPGVGELLHSATIAVAGEVPVEPAVARGAGVSDDQRGVAAAAGGVSRRVALRWGARLCLRVRCGWSRSSPRPFEAASRALQGARGLSSPPAGRSRGPWPPGSGVGWDHRSAIAWFEERERSSARSR